MSFLCGGRMDPPIRDWPDAGAGACCEESAYRGPEYCTCWEPIYDLEQAEPAPGHRGLRTQMCSDCAYRPGSPERQGDPAHAADEEELLQLVRDGDVFTCHQGIRRPVEWRHPSGVVIPGDPADYRPPIRDGIPYKADGTPADICAGWAALRLKTIGASS